MTDTAAPEWHKTACILCESNCGIEVRLGADGRTFDRIRGDKAHPASKGYTCEKALRLDHYQNGRHRLTSPMRRGDTISRRPSSGTARRATVASSWPTCKGPIQWLRSNCRIVCRPNRFANSCWD